ncbi:MAG: hypothetical protein HY738_06445 [Bacteroidia bacterium]|nr:hypothetical protein [Bacteroidia bacterium]
MYVNLLIISILIILIVQTSFCQINKYGVPFLRNYTPEEYKAPESNWAVIRDKRGVMFFGNDEQVLEYDGVNWRNIKIPKNASVRALAVDNSGTIYIGAAGDFGYLVPDEKGKLNFYSLFDQLDSSYRKYQNIYKIYIKGNYTYFPTNTGIFVYKDKKFQKCIPLSAKYCFYTFFVNNRFYVGSYVEGLMVIDGDSLIHVKGGDLFIHKNIFGILPYSKDFLLIMTDESLYLFNLNTGIGTNKDVLTEESLKLLTENEYVLYHIIPMPGHSYGLATLYNGCIVIDEKGRPIDHFKKIYGLQDEIVTYLDYKLSGYLMIGSGSRALCLILQFITVYCMPQLLQGSFTLIIKIT